MFELSQSIPIDRRRLLCAPASFDVIADGLVRSAGLTGALQYRGKQRHKKLPGCWRPKFQLVTDEPTGDQFFSSPVGYRAAFAHSTQHGEPINKRLLGELMPQLLKAAQAISTASVGVALSDRWAKIWISQKQGQFHDRFDLTEPEILVPQWIANRERALAFGINRLKTLQRAEQPLERKAIWGVRLHSPIFVLEILGAWMSETGEVMLPTLEKQRGSLDIHEFGFA
jgi:hypothetical protein